MNQDLLKEKEQLVDEILENLSNWNKNSDEAITILKKNNKIIAFMQKIDENLSVHEKDIQKHQQQKKMTKIIEKQKEMIAFLSTEKEIKREQLIQISSKEKVVSNYINLQKKSAFVKKNY